GGDYREAISLLESSLAARPDRADVLFKIGELYTSLDETESARFYLTEGLKISDNSGARNFLGYLEEVDGNYDLAVVQFEKVLENEPDNLYALVHAGLSYQQSGKPQQAIQRLGAAATLDPDRAQAASANLDFYAGLAYEDMQQYEEALTSFDRANRESPGDSRILRRLARTYEVLAYYDDALAFYQEAYTVDPTDEEARAAYQSLSVRLTNAEPEETRNESYDLIPAVVILPNDIDARIASAPNQMDYPDADAVILLNRSQQEILPDGRSRFTTQQVVRLFHRRAFADYGEIAVPFNSSSQNIAVNVARTILSDGTVIDVSDDGIRDVTPPETLSFNLYSDMMWKVISFPSLEAGAIVEYQVTVEDAHGRGSTENLWSWGSMSFQASYPTLESQYALRLPDTVAIKWKGYNDASVKPTITKDDTDENGVTNAVYRWEYGETTAFIGEPGGPPSDDLAPRFAFTSVTSWDALHDWYYDLIVDRATLEGNVAEQAAALISAATTHDERVARIAEFVAQKTRYVAIQLGAGAYQPHTASEVLDRRYGDCKDKCMLLSAMLQTIGVESYPALINPSPLTQPDLDLPTLSDFSHMILAVPDSNAPSGYVWFDPTDDTLPFGRLPARDQDRRVMLVTPSGPVWVRTPTDKPDANRHDWSLSLTLNEDGSVSGDERLEATGTHAHDLRNAYESVAPSSLNDTLRSWMSASYPGLTLTDATLSGVEALSEPFVVTAQFEAPVYGHKDDVMWMESALTETTWTLPIPNAELSAYASLVVGDTRTTTLEIGAPNTLTRAVVIYAPEGLELVHTPAPIELDLPFGRFYRQVEATSWGARYDMTLVIRAPYIKPERYADAKRFFETIAREDAMTLTFATPPPPAVEVIAPEPTATLPEPVEETANAEPTDSVQPDAVSTDESDNPVETVNALDERTPDPVVVVDDEEFAPTDDPSTSTIDNDASSASVEAVDDPVEPTPNPIVVVDNEELTPTDDDASNTNVEGDDPDERTPNPVVVVEDDEPGATDETAESSNLVQQEPVEPTNDEKPLPEPVAPSTTQTEVTTTSVEQTAPKIVTSPLNAETQDRLNQLLMTWLRAWEQRSPRAYMELYAANAVVARPVVGFDGSSQQRDLTRAELSAQMLVAFLQYGRIQTDAEAIRFDTVASGEHRIRFRQSFIGWSGDGIGSPTEAVERPITLIVRDGKIVRESWTMEADSPPVSAAARNGNVAPTNEMIAVEVARTNDASPDQADTHQNDDSVTVNRDKILGWHVQVASFRAQTDAAEFYRDVLRLELDAPSRIDEATLNNGTWYRVVLGPFSSRDDAYATRDRVKSETGEDPLV
ncbi:MAG: DUF3857 domain-containing protein, partial [Candidatus Poribacteria bacterium]|nr:DUF3857 domain-containing protein [Candidatus Poribacteria bacterium]